MPRRALVQGAKSMGESGRRSAADRGVGGRAAKLDRPPQRTRQGTVNSGRMGPGSAFDPSRSGLLAGSSPPPPGEAATPAAVALGLRFYIPPLVEWPSYFLLLTHPLEPRC